MAHRFAAPLAALVLFLPGCEAFHALGPNGCDETHLCTNPERPRCDVTARRCVPAEPPPVLADLRPAESLRCIDHGDCPSTICDELGLTTAEAGRCIPDDDVAPVHSAAELRDALLRFRGVRLLPGTYAGEWIIAQRSVVLVGPQVQPIVGTPALLRSINPGPVLRLGPRAQVMLDGITVQGGTGTAGHGVVCESSDGRLALRRSEVSQNAGRGIWARCPLQITQSRIGGWGGVSNQGGGLLAEDALSITNSYFAYNGSTFSLMGAIALAPSRAERLLVHLTFVSNQSGAPGVAIDCGGADVTLWRSLLWNNMRQPGRPLLSGGCRLSAAAVDDPDFFQEGTVRLDVGNPPRFKGLFDLHLKPDSPAEDMVPPGDKGPLLAVDYDGDRRPQGAGYDFGADEVPRR